MSDLKRFDDYQEVVDCNDCSHYWDSSCDGASKGSTANCNSFSATRSIVIPEKLNKLEERVKWLELCTIFLFAMVGILYLLRWF